MYWQNCSEQLATNAIDPNHFKEHLFFDPFRIFYKGFFFCNSDFGQKYTFF